MRRTRWIASLLLACCTLAGNAAAWPASDRAFSTDIDRFWRAYDQIRAEPIRSQQRKLLQRVFLYPGSDGLKAFMQAKGYDADCYLDAIRDYPRFWDSVRPRTFALKRQGSAFAPEVARLRALYPALRPARVYFTIGCLRSSGTTVDDKVLIGAELAAGDAGVDLSELPQRLRDGLGVYFASQPARQLALLDMHEYVHTQQRGPGSTLLAQALYEGAADFVAEQATGRRPDLPYVGYGDAHADTLRAALLAERDARDWSGWLYNGTDGPHGIGDLGYAVGYGIVRDYYARAIDKQQALREIIELDYRDPAAAERFARQAGALAP
jgi:hypothetical protein